jgi:hypothetical protein
MPTNHPPIPPSYPTFMPLLARIPVLIRSIGAAQTAAYLRRVLLYQDLPDAPPDHIDELQRWLRFRISELEGITNA